MTPLSQREPSTWLSVAAVLKLEAATNFYNLCSGPMALTHDILFLSRLTDSM